MIVKEGLLCLTLVCPLLIAWGTYYYVKYVHKYKEEHPEPPKPPVEYTGEL